MTARRTDSNQAEIVAALRHVGASVQDLHEVGKGCPDILVGYRGRNYLIEIKAPGGRLNKREREWHDRWDGLVFTVWTIEGALDIIQAAAYL